MQDAQASLANSHAVANHACEQVNKANQDLKSALLKIQVQKHDLKLQEQAREEAQAKAKATEKELRDALQSAEERVRKAEYDANTFHSQLRDKERELKKERNIVTAQKQTIDAHRAMLPS